MPNIIKQIVSGFGDRQTIKMVVRDNERGKQGEQGDPGQAATVTAGNAYIIPENQNPSVINSGTSSDAVFDFYIPKGAKGDPGQDGAVHYTAGNGIEINANNVISATGTTSAAWGSIVGTLANQTDLSQALADKQGKLTAGSNITLSGDTISATDTTYNNFTGTDGVDAGTAGLVPAPAATDANKYLKSDGAWGTISIPTVGDATITIKNNSEVIDSFTVNASADKDIDIAAPVITMTSTDPGEGVPLAANHFIAVYDAS